VTGVVGELAVPRSARVGQPADHELGDAQVGVEQQPADRPLPLISAM